MHTVTVSLKLIYYNVTNLILAMRRGIVAYIRDERTLKRIIYSIGTCGF